MTEGVRAICTIVMTGSIVNSRYHYVGVMRRKAWMKKEITLGMIAGRGE